MEVEGKWDIRKEILGSVFDGTCWYIELLIKKLDTIILEIKIVLRLRAVSYKKFENLNGRLQHAAIELPVGRAF